MTQNVRHLKVTTTGRKRIPITTETKEKETSSESTEKS